MPRDFLDEMIAVGTKQNPGFPKMVDDAEARRKMARELAAKREKLGLSQTIVAARMGTSASVVSKLESGADVKLSTFQRYCAVVGQTLTVKPARRVA